LFFCVAFVVVLPLPPPANATIFSVVNAVMLRPLPFTEPDRLVQLAEKNDKLNLPNSGVSGLNFLSWREQIQTIKELAAIGFSTFTLSGTGEPEQLSGNRISPTLPHLLGI
jgi:putative ABC transport system permease protein